MATDEKKWWDQNGAKNWDDVATSILTQEGIEATEENVKQFQHNLAQYLHANRKKGLFNGSGKNRAWSDSWKKNSDGTYQLPELWAEGSIPYDSSLLPQVAIPTQYIPMGWSWRSTDGPVTGSFEAADEKKLREQSNKYLDKWVAENYGKEYMPSEEDYNAFYAMMLNKNGQKKSGTFFTPALEKYQIPYQPIAPEGEMSVAPEIVATAIGGSGQGPEAETEVKPPIVEQKGEAYNSGNGMGAAVEAAGGGEAGGGDAQSSATGIAWLDNAMRVAEQGGGQQGGEQGGEKREVVTPEQGGQQDNATVGQGASSATFTPTNYSTTAPTSYAERLRRERYLRGNNGGGATTGVARPAATSSAAYYPEIVENPDNILDVWYNRSNAAAQRRANIQQEIQNWRGRGESAKQAMLKAMEPQKNEEKEKRLRDTTKMQAITDFLTALATGVIGAESKNYAPQTPANAQQYAVNLANLQQLNEARDEKYRQLKGQMDYQQWQQEGETLAKMDAEAAKDAREADRLIGNYFISELRGENSLENMLTQRELSLWSKLREKGYYSGEFEEWAKLPNDEKNKVIDEAIKAEEAKRNRSGGGSGGGSGRGTPKTANVGGYEMTMPTNLDMDNSIPGLYAELVRVGASPRMGKIKVNYNGGLHQVEEDGEVAPTKETEFIVWLNDNINNEAVRKYLQQWGFTFKKK